ncbi:MAG: pilus assembly protein PilY, partial [Burkholderia sp.]|nr:pilus assembly protein PilY [Burkholderia sp.]
YIPGNTRTTYGNSVDANDAAREIDAAVVGKTAELDVKPWTEAVGKMEASRNANLADLHTKDTGSGGHGTYYMAGLSHWANTQDIRLDKKIRVKTFSIDVDEGGNGLIDGNNRTIKPRDSQLYLAAKYGGRTGNESECDAGGDTPSNYFLASQPNEMIRSIRTVFDRIGGSSGTISGVSVSTTKISSDGAFVFQPGFNSSNWCGSLKKLRLSLDNDTVTIAKTAVWDAGEILAGKGETVANPQAADRKIYTSAIEGTKFLPSIPFKWETNDVSTGKDELTEGLKALFKTNPGNGAEDGHGMDRVRYLRGDRSLETSKLGGIFRARGSVLGDIINSNPLYVGPPALNVQGDNYQTFYDKNKARAKAVYVGANDGMLHAFSADDGRELFAYVPNVLIPALSQLTRPDYSHRAYMDGMMSVADAKVDTEWKTVLAAGLGGGAQGVIALDVTNPLDFGGAIFEFTDADDKAMGNVVSAPVIAKFMTKSPKNAAPEYKYFLVVSSGLNNYKDDGIGKFNPDAPGVLFLLSLDKAPGAKWQVGRNYFKFTTQNTDATLQNGLGSPALVVGANGVVRYGYAGDLQGNLWRFDFTGAEPFSKKPPKPTLLFTANDEQGQRQPVTTQPKVVFAPGGGYVVLFGTGKFLENTDVAPGEFKSQSFYGILDTTKSDYTVSGRKDLVKRVLETRDNGASLELTGNEFSYLDSKGWYFDFLDSATTGERSVTNGLVANGRIFFNTLIPGADPCSAGGGRTYILDTLTGMPQPTTDPLTGLPSRVIRTGFRSTVGMLSSPVVFDTSANVGDRNAVGRRKVTKNSSVFNFGTDGAAPAERIATDVPAGRFSWREILNWLDK